LGMSARPFVRPRDDLDRGSARLIPGVICVYVFFAYLSKGAGCRIRRGDFEQFGCRTRAASPSAVVPCAELCDLRPPKPRKPTQTSPWAPAVR